MARRRSNTIAHGLREQEVQNQNCYSFTQEAPTVKIVVRRSSKPSRTLEIPSVLRGANLFDQVEREFHIPVDKQILFCAGKRIESNIETNKKQFIFKQNDILHVHCTDNTTRKKTTIYLQFLNAELVKYRQIKISTNSNEGIINTLEDELIYEIEDIDQYIFVQSGRLINIFNSYQDEAIEDESIILVSPKNIQKQNMSRFEDREIQLVESKSKLIKRSSLSLNVIEDFENSPDFKKKTKFCIYKSMVLPESMELVWEIQPNGEVCKKKLLQQLLKKKNRFLNYPSRVSGDEEIKGNFSEGQNSNFSIELDEKQKKEFFGEIDNINKETANLKLPLEMSTDFLDDVQELEFQEDEIKKNQTMHFSAPLTEIKNNLHKSIGKSKGTFVPILNVNMNVDLEDCDFEDN